MSLILLACAATSVAPVASPSPLWDTPVPVQALGALGAAVSGGDIGPEIERLAEAEAEAWGALPACDGRLDALDQVRVSLSRWPQVEGGPVDGVEPLGVRLMGAGALDAQIRSGKVALSLEALEAACAAGEGQELAAFRATNEVLEMQAVALGSLSEVARFLAADELARVVGGAEVRGWLGLPMDPPG